MKRLENRTFRISRKIKRLRKGKSIPLSRSLNLVGDVDPADPVILSYRRGYTPKYASRTRGSSAICLAEPEIVV